MTPKLQTRIAVASLIFVMVIIAVTSLVTGHVFQAIFWPLAVASLARSFYVAGKEVGNVRSESF